MSTLAVVEKILRETKVPMSVREIVEHAGETLPTKSKTPDTVVARDLSMDIKKKGEESLFIRTSPGRYTMRELVVGAAPATSDGVVTNGHATEIDSATPMSSVLGAERAGTKPATDQRRRLDTGEESVTA